MLDHTFASQPGGRSVPEVLRKIAERHGATVYGSWCAIEDTPHGRLTAQRILAEYRAAAAEQADRAARSPEGPPLSDQERERRNNDQIAGMRQRGEW